MKKFIVIFFCFCAIQGVYSQHTKKDVKENVSLHKANLPLEAQVKMIEGIILHNYGKTFKYYSQIKSGDYRFEYQHNKSGHVLNILNKNNQIIDIIKLKLEFLSGNSFLSIDFNNLEHDINNSNSNPMHYGGWVEIIDQDNIMTDKQILKNDNIPSEYWKILNRTLSRKFEDQNGDDLDLFMECDAGKLIPYESGANSKVLTIDKLFHTIVYFDTKVSEDDNQVLNQVYGYGGNGNGQFYNPTGIALGRSYTSRSNVIYPVFVADYNNCRLVRANYIINDSYSGLGSFDTSSFNVIANIPFPHDVQYFQADESSDDKIWVSHTLFTHCSLVELTSSGLLFNNFVGYQDDSSGDVYYFNSESEMRLSLYSHGFNGMSFIDSDRNWLVSCLLDSYGSPSYIESPDHYNHPGNIIIAQDIEKFHDETKINSVTIQRTYGANDRWPNVWITSPSRVHLFKMNKSAHLAYMGSTAKPRTTTDNFNSLLNTMMLDDYYDMLTIESWNDSYGIRKYWEFCDRRSDTLFNYCTDSTDIMKYQAFFTNDCWLYFSANRKNKDGNWEQIKIKRFDGADVNDTFFVQYQPAGFNQNSSDLYANLQLDLPIQDYALGGQVKLTVKMFPEYYYPIGNLTNTERVDKDYIADIKKLCIQRPGGCPFVYLKDGNNNYYADNNILDKSEYSGSSDITDKYKLLTTPQIINNSIALSLVENENDNGYINMAKLFAVDYPSNRKLGVTDGNVIVIYDSNSVVASDSVMLNGSTNITSNVNYFNPGTSINRYKLDSIYAHFHYGSYVNKDNNTQADSKIEVKSGKISRDGPGGTPPNYAFIANIGNLIYPIVSAKDTGGVLTAHSIFSNSTTTMFGRRERSSVVILPLFGDSNKVNDITIKWQDDYQLKYIGMGSLEYSGFNVNEIPFNKGRFVTTALDSDITTQLSTADTAYGLVNSSGLINLFFNTTSLPSVPSHYLRGYVLEITGHYTVGTDNMTVKGQNQVPLVFKLSQNYPNPFNPTTKISYEIPKDSRVKLIIYDILGREVKRLVDNDLKQAGHYIIDFDGTNLASGVYFYHIEAGTFIESKKMVLLK